MICSLLFKLIVSGMSGHLGPRAQDRVAGGKSLLNALKRLLPCMEVKIVLEQETKLTIATRKLVQVGQN